MLVYMAHYSHPSFGDRMDCFTSLEESVAWMDNKSFSELFSGSGDEVFFPISHEDNGIFMTINLTVLTPPFDMTMASDTGVDEKQPLTISQMAPDGDIAISFDGYGDYSAPNSGAPLVIAMVDGCPRLEVWSDINEEEPMHIISLSGAKTEALI